MKGHCLQLAVIFGQQVFSSCSLITFFAVINRRVAGTAEQFFNALSFSQCERDDGVMNLQRDPGWQVPFRRKT